MDGNCIFCKIVKGEIETQIIYESDNFIAFPDANQKVEGHTLIIPKKHFVNSLDIPSSLGSEFFDVVKEVAQMKLKEGFQGFNIAQNNFECAGQKVMHTHYHILPRKSEDRYKFFD